RGGQAAAMAVDRDRWFSDDSTLPDPNEYDIKAVIALAPTDKVVDNEQSELEDIYYLTIHGARDADVNSFYGERQYLRTTFTGQKDRFKSSLYISNANHSRFNTEWGSLDSAMPVGLFLNVNNMLEGEEQRTIAK